MNSKQRRQFNRKTNHQVILDIKNERYFQFDMRVEKAKTYCRRKCKGAWMLIKEYNRVTFKFQKESDAILFSLINL